MKWQNKSSRFDLAVIQSHNIELETYFVFFFNRIRFVQPKPRSIVAVRSIFTEIIDRGWHHKYSSVADQQHSSGKAKKVFQKS